MGKLKVTGSRAAGRRLPGDVRREQIIFDAKEAFSRKGVDINMRTLAKELGIAPSLIYRHFKSRQELLDTVFDEAIENNFSALANNPLGDSHRPLEERLVDFYLGITRRRQRSSWRLLIQMALRKPRIGPAVAPRVTRTFIAPLVDILRKQCELPSLKERPLMRGEREMVLAFHGQFDFLDIRRHIFEYEDPTFEHTVRSMVRIFLKGVGDEMRHIHSLPADHVLTQIYEF